MQLNNNLLVKKVKVAHTRIPSVGPTLGNRVWATFTCRVPELIRVLGSQPAGDVSHKPGGKKGRVFPYSLPSVGPGADPGVQAVSPQVT